MTTETGVLLSYFTIVLFLKIKYPPRIEHERLLEREWGRTKTLS